VENFTSISGATIPNRKDELFSQRIEMQSDLEGEEPLRRPGSGVSDGGIESERGKAILAGAVLHVAGDRSAEVVGIPPHASPYGLGELAENLAD